MRSLYLFARAISEMKVIDEIYDFSLPFLYMAALRKFLVHIIYSHERLISEISNVLMIVLIASVRKNL